MKYMLYHNIQQINIYMRIIFILIHCPLSTVPLLPVEGGRAGLPGVGADVYGDCCGQPLLLGPHWGPLEVVGTCRAQFSHSGKLRGVRWTYLRTFTPD